MHQTHTTYTGKLKQVLRCLPCVYRAKEREEEEEEEREKEGEEEEGEEGEGVGRRKGRGSNFTDPLNLAS